MPPAVLSASVRTALGSAGEAAFSHYLRTGERLTGAQWLARQEVKFNPWHDRLGRFTYGPGGTGAGLARGAGSARRPAGALRHPLDAPARGPHGSGHPGATGGGSGFRSALVRDAFAPETSTADTYFELNKRQAVLDRLRAQAGAHPASASAGDLAELQLRLDANRALLDARYRIADQQAAELLRSGLAPADIAAGGARIVTGQGEPRDYLAVAAVVPVGGVVSKIGKAAEAVGAAEGVTRPLGGAYRVVRKLQPKGNHAHHLIPTKISPLPKWGAPTVSVLASDHASFLSTALRTWRAQRYWDLQVGTIRKRGIIAALKLDARFIRRKVGNKYDAAIEEAIAYAKSIGYKSWLMKFILSKGQANLNSA